MRYLVFALIVLSSGSGIGAPAVHAALSTPPATQAMADLNEPYAKRTCHSVPNNTVTGRVTSSTTIQMPKFRCRRGDLDGDAFNTGRCKDPVDRTPNSVWGPYCQITPWLTMTVELANPADAGKMPLGKLVTLKGDFFVITKNKVSYLFVKSAKVLYADPFGR